MSASKSTLGKILGSSTEIQELRNCLNVSVNRYIFTPRPTAYTFIDFCPPEDLTPDQKEKIKSTNKDQHGGKSIKQVYPHVELVFIPISVEKGFRYDLPCIWIPAKNKSDKLPPQSSSSSSSPKRFPTILYFHGSSGNVGQYFSDLDKIVNDVRKRVRSDLGISDGEDVIDFDILLVEYPGYGLASPFLPRAGLVREDKDRVKDYDQQVIPTDFLFSSTGCLFHPNADKLRLIGTKILDFVLTRRAEIAATSKTFVGSATVAKDGEYEAEPSSSLQSPNQKRDIILMGRSLGSGLVLELATNPLFVPYFHSVILLSPYTSIPRVIREVACEKLGSFLGSNVAAPIVNFFLKISNSEFFNSLENIKKLDKEINLLLIHGELDYFISKQHSVDLVASYRSSVKNEKHKQDKNNSDNVELLFDPAGDHGNLDYMSKVVGFLANKFKEDFEEKQDQKKSQQVLRLSSSKGSMMMNRSENLIPTTLVANSKQNLTTRKARFFQESLEAAKLKSKALNTLRFVLIMSIVISFSVSYVWTFGVPELPGFSSFFVTTEESSGQEGDV